MRRKDREIKDPAKTKEIITACHCCRIGLCDEGKVYIVPMNFGFIETDGNYTFYFHSAKEGRKLDLIKKTGYAGFEMDTNYHLKEADTACEHTASFQSVIGSGVIEIVEDYTEKKNGLMEIMKKNTRKAGWEFAEGMVNAVTVFKLTVEELACKEHL